MNFRRAAVGIFLLALTAVFAQTNPQSKSAADRLYRDGKFSEAEKLYSSLVAEDQDDWSSELRLAQIALLDNELDDAESWAKKALSSHPKDGDAQLVLAETLYRRNQFPQAAAALADLGPLQTKHRSNYSVLNAAKLESFRGLTPYEIEGRGESTELPFIKTDPLPLVKVRVNGGHEATFFIDTGNSELLLDSAFARELGITIFGSMQGTFAGGKHASYQPGRIESVTLGGWVVKNVPVNVMPLRQLSSGFGIRQLDGCIGTNVLYQFLSTIDYRNERLILRRKTAANEERFNRESAGKDIIEVPFWLAGDHFIVGWGQIETLPPALLFVDSGLAGAAVKLSNSVIRQAGIKLDLAKASVGNGGGGQIKTIPFTVRKLSLGELAEENVPGMNDGPFPWQSVLGFYVGGMVGHEFLSGHTVTLDFTEMKLVIQQAISNKQLSWMRIW